MVTFVLKDKAASNPTLIYLTFYFRSRRMKFSTSQRIHPRFWNPVKHRARKEAPGELYLNAYLDKIEKAVKAIYLKLLSNDEEITPDRLREELSIHLHTGGKRETFIEWITRYRDQSKAGTATKKIYLSVINLLKGFPGKKDFADINAAWFEHYIEYLEGRGLSANYIGKNINYLKILLNEATEQGVNRSLAYKSKKHRRPSEEAETIYLSENELLNMYGIELPAYLDRVRDRFMIGAFTGLRFSDFTRITPASISPDAITNVNVKTGTRVVIPLHWVVRQIIDKCDGILPTSISNQKMNDYIKLVAKRAGIEYHVIKHRTNGGVRTGETFKKWELVTTHTARRSFATNAYLAGVPTVSIMKITGHKTERSFLKYIRISQQENAAILSVHPFFQAPG